ncbi:hypothetical protein Ancab_032766 [Ancistrocladus abbreviatus]
MVGVGNPWSYLATYGSDFEPQEEVVHSQVSFSSFQLLGLTSLGHLEGEDEADLKGDAAYTSLQGEDVYSSDDNVTPFAKARFLSRMTFWWLNSVMKRGKKKVLEDNDIPLLRWEDRANTCYLEFMEQLNRQKEKGSSNPSILSTIFSWLLGADKGINNIH